MPNLHKRVLSLAAPTAIAVFAFIALLAFMPFHSAQAAGVIPISQADSHGAMTDTMPMMGDMMSMTSGMMDMMQMMQMMHSMPMTGTMPGMTNASPRGFRYT
jgi:hypothetical protein